MVLSVFVGETEVVGFFGVLFSVVCIRFLRVLVGIGVWSLIDLFVVFRFLGI